ncbi:MAG: type II secretion system secretin GspD [Xanthobacteraceae bacterium]
MTSSLLASLLGLAALLSGCDSFYENKLNRTPDPFEAIRNIDLSPRFPGQGEASRPPPKRGPGASYYGRDPGDADAAGATAIQPTANGDGYELNFENAPVTTVAKVIIGDILGAGYTIDPRIQGTVTIASGRPIPKKDLVYVLENALRISNVVLVPDASGYRLIPAADAAGTGRTSTPGHDEPGYGTTVVPLQFAAAPAILKLLDSFALKAGVARADAGRNLIVIQGSGPERQSAVETVLSFDVDWMKGQSVGVYPLESATPEAIIAEMEKIMETGEGGLNQALVKFQPIARLNAVLVVTKKPNLLRTAATWITRLDKSNTAAAGVRVYRLRYASARQVSFVLNDIFGTRSGSGLDSAANQLAPGGGVITSGSDRQAFFDVPPGGRVASQVTPTGGGLGGGSFGGGGGSFGGGGGGPFGGGSGGGGTFGGAGGQTGLGGGLGGGVGGAGTQLTSPGAVAGERGQQGQQPPSVVAPGIRITADVANNSLLILANQENYRLIEQTLRQIDRPQLQVAINATIAEITLNNDLRYGVQYMIQSGDIGYAKDKGSFGLQNNGPASAMSNIISRVLPGANLLLGPEGNPRVILDALRAITDVKVLSTPSLVVMDNQAATLQVGDQVPIATQSATILTNPNTPLVNTIDYRNTGVILRVLPRINVNGNVILDIEQEISNIAPNANAETLTPTVSQRRIKSSIAVATGQAVLLGGLISDRQERGRSGIPILEELPGVGDAFSKNTRTTHRTELIIFIQPQIIRDSVDAYKVAEELRAKLRGTVESSFPPGPSLRRDPNLVR